MHGKFMQGQMIKNLGDPELLSLFVTHCHNEIHITINFH